MNAHDVPPRGRQALRRAAAPVRRAAARFPWERALLLGVAAVVGIYAGIAAGLFAQSIRFVQILVFGGSELGAVFSGTPSGSWAALFGARLGSATWHFEFAVLAVLLLAGGAALERLSERRKVSLPRFEVHRLRAVASAGALGLALYYPLVVLRAFNGTFPESEGGLYEMVRRAPRWLWVLAPALGALAGGLIVRYVSPESGGHGVVEVIEAMHVRARKLRGRVAVWKGLAAGLVIGSGGSAGREGPVVHIGGAVAAALGRSLSLPRRQIVLLLACGAGAGIAASFQAPFAGTMFALEIMLAGFAAHQIGPVVLACVTATATSRALLGGSTELRPVVWTLEHPSEIAVYLVLGAVAGLCGAVYIRALEAGEELFSGHRGGAVGRFLATLPAPAKGAVGGLAVGLLALIAPRALGTGIESMNAALAGELLLGVLCLSLVVKLAATAFTLGSGSPAGSFFPAVFLGAMLGGAFGDVAHKLAPGMVSAASSYAAVGMGAVVAGATVAPLTGVMMMVELTGSYQIVAPLLLACGTAAAVVQGLLGASIYTLASRRRGLRLRRHGLALSELSVAQALERGPALAAGLSGDALRAALAEASRELVVVRDAARGADGLLSVADAQAALQDGAPAATAGELAQIDGVARVYEDDDLEEALHVLAGADSAAALVVASDDAGRAPLGYVTRKGILEAWRRAVTAQV